MTTKPEANGERTVTVKQLKANLAQNIEEAHEGAMIRIVRNGVEIGVMRPPDKATGLRTY